MYYSYSRIHYRWSQFLHFFVIHIKLFCLVNCLEIAVLLHFDLNFIYKWCITIYFTVNINKCQIMSMTF